MSNSVNVALIALPVGLASGALMTLAGAPFWCTLVVGALLGCLVGALA